MTSPSSLQRLIVAVGQWYRTRGGPRKVERDAEIALETVCRDFFRSSP